MLRENYVILDYILNGKLQCVCGSFVKKNRTVFDADLSFSLVPAYTLT